MKKQNVSRKTQKTSLNKIPCALARAKRKRCYDVMLSRQEGSMTRHLASALVLRTDLPVETQDVFF